MTTQKTQHPEEDAMPDTKPPLQRFKERLKEHGATLTEPEWLGAHTPHRVRCAGGHACTAVPHTLPKRTGICPACRSEETKNAAWNRFRTRVEAEGATVLEPAWLGPRTPHRIRCADGHEHTLSPERARKTGHICRTCATQARNDQTSPEIEAFQELLNQHGAVLEETRWHGARHAYRITCANGHTIRRSPRTVTPDKPLCLRCRPSLWERFNTAVQDQGGTVLEPAWLGLRTPHLLRCRNGHEHTRLPSSIIERGSGICRICN